MADPQGSSHAAAVGVDRTAPRGRPAERWGGILPLAPQLSAFCRHLARRYGLEPEDLLQETCLRGLQGMERSSPPRNRTAWLCGIARRVACEWRRQAGQGAALQGALAEAADWSPGQGSASGDGMEGSERAAILDTALRSLTPEHRRAITMHHLEGRSVAELAARMGLGIEATESLLRRARHRLTKAIKASLASPEDLVDPP